MNVIGQENKLGNPRAQERGRGRGKVGKIMKDQAPVTLVPKYRIPELRRPLINIGPSITPRTPRTPRGPRRVGTTSSSSAARGTPGVRATDTTSHTTSMSAYPDEQFVIVAVTAGRGQARGEIGMAAIDLQYPHMILCQMSDDNSYINALTKIHMFQPVEILMPDTMGKDHNDPNSLYMAIKTRFPRTQITEISRIHWNAVTGLERIQSHSISEFSSIELIVKPKYYALSAVCTLFKYIESIQHIVYTQNSVRFEYQAAQNTTMIDLESAQNLELVTSYGNKGNFSLLGAMDRCSTPAGRRLLRASILQPPCNEEIIEKRQNCVNELVSNKSLFSIIHPVIRRLSGAHRLLNFVTQHPYTETIECAERNLNYALLLKQTLDIIPELRAALTTAVSPFFRRVTDNLRNESFEMIREEILRIIHPDVQSVKGYTSANYQRCFAIKAGISDALDVARQTYCELIEDMENTVKALGERYNMELLLACSSNLGYHIEMKLPRNFKFDVNSLPEELIEGHVKGATVYMTTQELFVRNQHTKDAYVELHLMSNAVLNTLFDAIKGQIGCLFYFNDDVAEMDVILSLTTISSISDFVRPTFGVNLEVRNGKHPVMDILGAESPTPNDIVASTSYNFHTIAGPNMGGKTIYLKQIVLLHIMAQIGCFVPASKAQFRVTDHIFCRIGVRDDIAFNASSFMLEIQEAQYILQSLTPNSLVILDELCRSTTVEEGASLAWAISKRLLLSAAFTFSSTHFETLLKLADLYPNVTNHHFEAIPNGIDRPEEARLVYTHKLKPGIQKIQNYGLILARATGLPEDVLADAQRFAQQIRASMETHQPPRPTETPPPPTQSKIKRNYDKIARVFDKLEDNYEVPDDELYTLVRGLEAISYEEPSPEVLEPPQADKPSEESSGLYSAGPKGSTTTDTPLKKSQEPVNTVSSKRTSPLDPENPKTSIKRQVKFTGGTQPAAKLSKLEETRPLTSRQPLATMNPPKPSEINSPFKVPLRPFMKKNLTQDPESPLFKPRGSQISQTPFANLSSSQSSARSSITVSQKASKPGSFSQLQSLTLQSRPVKKKRLIDLIPESFHHMFSSKRPVFSQSPVDHISNLPVQMVSQQSRAETIASLPMFLRPVGENSFFPKEFTHLRHIVKNIYEEPEVGQNPGGSNQYYFMSKPVKRTPGSSTNDSDERGKIRSPSLVNYPQGMVSDLKKMMSSDELDGKIAGISGMGLLEKMEQGLDSNLIILSSDSEEDEEVISQCSMSSEDAKIAAREKEAAIFRKIEGEGFDEVNFFADLHKSLKR